MSRQNADHYMRFRDQMKVGADGQKLLRRVSKRGLDHEPADGYIDVDNPGLGKLRAKRENFRKKR